MCAERQHTRSKIKGLYSYTSGRLPEPSGRRSGGPRGVGRERRLAGVTERGGLKRRAAVNDALNVLRGFGRARYYNRDPSGEVLVN